ncbi:hypothetical protein BYT27DRAFT_7255056 [Phlegmacium glaucopus]|nr:hypothetical protein BYT27DRAFT_7255056 [Phlegmacium glaucopus]
MSKLTRMQWSYRWQSHLPFMPVHLASDPWMKQYDYKYDTLPILQVGPSSWSLDPRVVHPWYHHVEFFSLILSTWRNHLAMAPMSVTNIPHINNMDISRGFPTERQARLYFWFYCTMVFSMFAEFSFAAAGKPKWREQFGQICTQHGYPLDEKWLNEVDGTFCDFSHTKHVGVVIHVATTEIWSFLPRYHKNGVPILMDVGYVTFHDRDQYPKLPTIHITTATPGMYNNCPADWPSHLQLVGLTQKHLSKYYEDRLGAAHPPPQPLQPLLLSRPPVQELGGEIHQQAETHPWINPNTNQPTDFIQLATPIPANTRRRSDELDWVEFFKRRREVNAKIQARETV